MASTFVAAFEILSFGAIIVLVVLGLGIIASMMGIFNFAQGEFVLLGAYITYLAFSQGVPIWVGMVAAPFIGQIPLGLAVCLVGLGLVERDGLFIIAGALVGVVGLVLSAGFAYAIISGLVGLF